MERRSHNGVRFAVQVRHLLKVSVSLLNQIGAEPYG
jgi:hypothetical protein